MTGSRVGWIVIWQARHRRGNSVTLRFLLIALGATCMTAASANVWVYPGASATLKSPVYKVTVGQGTKRHESFVYADENKFEENRKHMTDWNHWTCFSFEDSVTVRVEVLNGPMGACTVYPLERGVEPVVQGRTLTFRLDRPAKLHVALAGQEEHPLFIFADPPETNVPDRADPEVVWFGPGIHEIGERYKMEPGKTYYLEGGAYVRGSFHGMQLSDTEVRGRGILSGENIPHMPYHSHEFQGVGIHFDGNGSNQLVEGITIINSSMYCIQSYCGRLATRNVKCFGWWYETDGWIGGDGSVLEDSFFKVNDDVVKLYNKNMTVRDLVIYHQFNGAPFQLGWSSESARDCTVENIDVINCEVNYYKVFDSNRALISRVKGTPASLVRGIHFKEIRIDRDVSAIVGISTAGRIEDLTIENLSVRGRQKWPSYLKGTMAGVRWTGLKLSGRPVRTLNDFALEVDGDVECSVLE